MDYQFKVISGSHWDAKGRKFERGDVVKSNKRLDQVFPNKFAMLTPDGGVVETVDIPEAKEAVEVIAEVEEAQKTKKVYRVMAKGGGYNNVVDCETGETINEKGLRDDDAVALVESLGGELDLAGSTGLNQTND